jgi:UDP-3-O-[3-hydroxymyristoyl] N-acetylglucosamine deacetylase
VPDDQSITADGSIRFADTVRRGTARGKEGGIDGIMTALSQRTIRQKVCLKGVGLHSGVPTELTLLPAPPDSGINFVRTDVEPAVEIPARTERVVDSALATTLGKDGVRIGTVEHLLAAFFGLGLDNVRVQVDGPEVPIMDGSSAPFASMIRSAGIEIQRRHKRFLVVRKTVAVNDGDKMARLSPAKRFTLSCTVDFKHPLISNQRCHVELNDRVFTREISGARTFGFLRDVEALKRAGFAKGGSLENAIVVDEFSILNPDGLRFPDEFVRHKVLDAIGDLGLLGMPVIGHFEGYKSGHAMNHRLVQRLLSDSSAYEILSAGAVDFDRLDLPLPVLSPAAA